MSTRSRARVKTYGDSHARAHIRAKTRTRTQDHRCLTTTTIGIAVHQRACRLQSAGSIDLTSDTALITVDFGSLVTIENDLKFSSCYYLTGSAITAGFGALQTVGGQFYMSVTSW